VDREIKGSVMSPRNKQERTESARRVETCRPRKSVVKSDLAYFRPKIRQCFVTFVQNFDDGSSRTNLQSIFLS